MPAPGKYPDELRRRAIGLTPGRPGPSRTGLGGVCSAWATSWGLAPGPCAAGIRQGVRVGRRGPARHHHRGARRTGEPGTLAVVNPAALPRGPAHRGAGVGGPRAGGGGAIGRSASACLWRRRVSARRADPPTASTNARDLTWLIVGRLGCWGLVVGGIVRVAWVEVRTDAGV